MKFCPYCGADLLDDNVLFCGQCGKKLPPHEAGITEPLTEEMRPEQEAPKPVPTKEKRKKKKKKPKKANVSELQEPVDDGYDGYYDDVLPPDTVNQVKSNTFASFCDFLPLWPQGILSSK